MLSGVQTSEKRARAMWCVAMAQQMQTSLFTRRCLFRDNDFDPPPGGQINAACWRMDTQGRVLSRPKIEAGEEMSVRKQHVD